MTPRIDIRPDLLRTVYDVLHRHLPDGVRVWVFGSRATGMTTDSSDLDLALEGDGDIPRANLSALETAFEDSDLPFAVDVVDTKRIGERFREIVTEQRVALLERDGSRTNESSSRGPFGVVPPGWEHSTLGAACERGGGNIQTGPFGSQLHASDYRPEGVPSIMPQNLGDNRVIADGIARIGDGDASRLRRYLVRKGDIVYSRRGDVEKRALIGHREDGWLCGTGCLRVRLGKNGADPRYASYYLGHPAVREWIVRHAHGATMPNLNTAILSACPFVVPPILEQRAIAHILGTLDDRIELNRRMNATLEAMARALFRSWFVDFEPVRAKIERRDTGLPKEIADLFPDRLVDSELGEIPEGWQLKSLDSVAGFQNGLALQKFRPSQNETRLPVVKIAQLRAGEANSGEWASASIKPECIIEDGDVVFSWSGSLLVRTWCGGRAALNQHLFKVTSERYPKWFYLHSIFSHFPEFQRIAADKATTMGHIRRHHLTDALCVVPPDCLITRVSGLLGGLLERRVANEVASRTLASLRDGLLPKLVSGELRVAGLEPASVPDDRPAPVGTHAP